MAKFTGSGTLNMSGGKIRDINFENGGSSLRLSGNGPMEISDVEFNGVTTAITGNAGGPPAHNVTVKNARFVGVTTAIEPYGNNWNIEGCDTSIVTTFIASSDAHDHLRVANSRTAGLIDTNGTSHVVMEGNIYRSLIDLGSGAVDVKISGVLETPGGAGSAIITATNLTGFHINLTAPGIDGYDVAALTGCANGELAGQYADITGGVVLDGCVDVDVTAQLGNEGGYFGGHGVVLDDCTRCRVKAKIIEPGQDANDTYDGVHLMGNSDDNEVIGTTVVPSSGANATRYGINVAASTCNDNIVVENPLGDQADYGTDALNDAGTDTILTYPNDATYGDNFVKQGS